MNKCIMCGRLTRDPEVRYTQSRKGEQMAVAKFSIAVDRKYTNGEENADFFTCVAFGKTGEFVEKYLKKATKVVVIGRVENNDYTNKNGEKVYSVQITVEEIEFAESKKKEDEAPSSPGFIDIPDGIEDSLPLK